jgi:hypothetical protein
MNRVTHLLYSPRQKTLMLVDDNFLTGFYSRTCRQPQMFLVLCRLMIISSHFDSLVSDHQTSLCTVEDLDIQTNSILIWSTLQR